MVTSDLVLMVPVFSFQDDLGLKPSRQRTKRQAGRHQPPACSMPLLVCCLCNYGHTSPLPKSVDASLRVS